MFKYLNEGFLYALPPARAAGALAMIICMIGTGPVYAACAVNNINYRTIGDPSGAYITRDILKNRAPAWDNDSDIVTTCDVSQITDMSQAFMNNKTFNQDLSAWDTPAVTSMHAMFANATSLTGVSLPQTGAVTTMYAMFYGATSLTGVSLPQTGAVTDMAYMFGRTGLTGVSLPDTSAVINMTGMFSDATSFAQDIRSWDVSSVSDFSNMFSGATAMINAYSSTPHWSTTPTAQWFTPDTTAPTIVSTSINSVNSELTVTFSEGVYNTIGGTGYLEVDDFALSIVGGTATLGSATPTSITKTSQTVWVLGFSTSGTANDSETITVAPASSTSIYDAAGNTAATSQSNNTASFNDASAPTVALAGPTDIVTDAFAVTATFSENVDRFDLGDITVENGTASALVANNAQEYTFTVTPVLGTTVSVLINAGVAHDAAGNANTASNTLSIQAGSPESYFAEQKEEIQAIITQDATRSLTSTLSSNQRMTRGARSRFIESRGQGEGDGAGLATRNNVPFDVDGTFDLAGARVSSKGTFFGQTGNVEGTERRLVFGEFDVQRDGDTGSSTATLTGRVAWEQMISDDTMLGYFVGGELADSNISGAFEGKQTRVAATAGGYAVRALSETLFADGFFSIGAGRNNLEMADDVLALTSDYTTRTATVGGALTGVYAYERYELRPEMAFSYGKTWIGDVGFTGVAYGLTDNTLSVDAGTVSTASLTLRPEIVWALDAETVAGSNAQLSFAPRFICERTTTATTTQDCGAGAEIGLSSNSEDGLSSANIRFFTDRVGNSNRSNVVFNVEQRF